jgi:hypothetical protein
MGMQMKHASSTTLDALNDLLGEIRKCEGLREKKRGTFYQKSNAFLHFHEDPSGFYADLRYSDGWHRLPINTSEESKILISEICQLLQL